MNTNDPAAKYGKPMMSDENIASYVQPVSGARLPIIGQASIFVEGACAARRFYENLITTGKLRVVVECRVKVDNSPGEWNGMHLFGCNGRGPVTDEVFCPYCGGSIIKPTQQP